MRRLNSSGIERGELVWALGQVRVVKAACREDSCLLCRGSRVNEAGICPTCVPLLSDEELWLAERWTSGVGP